nr:MAG: RNA-dependent RNA polymerase [Xinjiang mountain noda-like virus 2]
MATIKLMEDMQESITWLLSECRMVLGIGVAKRSLPSNGTMLRYGIPISVTIAGSVYVYYKIRQNKMVRAITHDGVYGCPLRPSYKIMLQRWIINKTRQIRSVQWDPKSFFSIPVTPRPNDNGHARSGAIRDSARAAITNAVTSAGFLIHEISPAKQSTPDSVEHRQYAPSDLHRCVEAENPPPNSIVVGIDVDYYFEDFELVLGSGNPAIFFTFNPISVSGNDCDSQFRIVDNVVVYDVGNGGRWIHRVWNWNSVGEFITTRALYGWKDWLLSFLGIETIWIHKVEVTRPWANAQNRAIVVLLPQYKVRQFKHIESTLYGTRSIRRMVYSDGNKAGWNRLVYADQAGVLQVSLGRQAEDYSITMKKTTFDVLNAIDNPLSVSSRMTQMKLHTDPEFMALFLQYSGKSDIEFFPTECLGKTALAAPARWPISPNVNIDKPKVKGRKFAASILTTEDCIPMNISEAFSESIDKRVTFVANKIVPTEDIAHLLVHFIRLVVGDIVNGAPYDVETTREKLTKPSQTLAINRIIDTIDIDFRLLIEGFGKLEAAAKPGRVVSSFADFRFIFLFSSFTLAFRDRVLHQEHNKHWFMPGRTPQEIAKAVQEYCSNVEMPLEGDYSNFDGRVSEWCQRNVMNAVYFRHFDQSFHAELRKFTNALITCPARSKKFHFYYESGTGVKSGSPTTCDLNTVLNAFIQFVAVKKTLPDLTHEEAFQQIGLAFGDDSLFDQRFKHHYQLAAGKLGMELKCEEYDHAKGVTFLARVFPSPTTTSTSFQDPLRTWRKLHLTTRDLNVPIADAAVDRCEGYLVTDKHTPVTGAFCSMIVREYTPLIQDDKRRKERKDRNMEKPYWMLNGDGSWPQDEKDKELMVHCIAARTGLNPEQVSYMDEKFLHCKDVFHGSFNIGVEEHRQNTFAMDGTPINPDAAGNQLEKNAEERKSDPSKTKPHRLSTNIAGPSKMPNPSDKLNDPRNTTKREPQGSQGSSKSSDYVEKARSDVGQRNSSTVVQADSNSGDKTKRPRRRSRRSASRTRSPRNPNNSNPI